MILFDCEMIFGYIYFVLDGGVDWDLVSELDFVMGFFDDVIIVIFDGLCGVVEIIIGDFVLIFDGLVEV